MSDTLLIASTLRCADTPANIHFVLTCYIEGLRLSNLASQLPIEIGVLPLNGVDDIKSRCAVLAREQNARHSSKPIPHRKVLLDEASLIFAVAHLRLKTLNGESVAKGSETFA